MIQLHYITPLDLILLPLLLGTLICVFIVLDLYNKCLTHIRGQLKEMCSHYYLELIDNNILTLRLPFDYTDYELALQKGARWLWYYKIKDEVKRRTWGRMLIK